MAGTIYSGTFFSGIYLSNPAVQNPATIAAGGFVTNTTTLHNGDAVYGALGTAWTLDNLGTITAATPGDGVQLASGGTVVNAASGLISGPASHNAVRIDGAAGTVVNYGNIGDITSYNSPTIYLTAGGAVTNAAGGLVQAGATGIEIAGAAGTVVNAGSISGTPGVSLQAGGAVRNTGVISGVVGVAAGTAAAAVVNFGTIRAGSRGVSLDAGGTVVNGSAAATGARITGYDGISIYGAAGGVTNFGTILATGGVGGAVNLYAGGSITNQAGALLEGGGVAVLVGGGAATITNIGTILGTSSYGIVGTGVASSGYGTITTGSTLINAGTIIGQSGSVYVYGTGFVTQPGTAVALAGAGNVVVDDAGAVFSGIVNGGTAGTLELAAGTGTGTLSGFGTSFVGFGAVTVEAGASWQLAAGNAIPSGTVLTDSGTLANAGAIATRATLFPSGSLINSGAITGAVMLSTGGTLDNLANGLIIGAGPIVYGGSGTVLNAGTITGTGTSGAGVFLEAGSTLTNAGTITGASGTAISFYGSNNRLILDPGETIGGTSIVTGTAAGNTLELAAGAVTGTINSAFSGFDTLQEDASASWTVPGSFTFATGTIAAGASLTETGPLTFTGSLVNSGTVAASVTLAAGASLTNQAFGVIDGLVLGSSNDTLANAGTIAGPNGTAVGFTGSGNRVVVDPGAVFSGTVDGGTGNDTLELTAGAIGTLSGLGTQFTGFTTVAVDPAAVWQVSDAATAPPGFINDGTIVVGAAGLVLGAVSEDSGKSGVIEIGSGAAEFTGTVAAGQRLVFTGAAGHARLDQPGGFAGAVAGFQPGDTLDLAGIVANTASYANGVLTLSEGGAQVARLALSTPLGSHASFRLYPDGAGGTDLTVAARPGNIFSGFYPNGILLDNPPIESQPTITATAYVTNIPGSDSVHATAGFTWTLSNYGRIAGPGNGVSLAAPGTVDNSGTITGTNGIDLAAGGAIANSGTVTGSANAGVYMGDGGTILNGVNAAGALLTGRYGIEIGGSASSGLLAVNRATIYGTNIGFAGGGAVGDILVNAGTIGGGSGTAVQFGGGADLLVVDPHAVFHGRVDGGAGYNAIELAAGSGAGTLFGLGAKFRGFGEVAVDPGAVWHMADAPTAAPAFTNDGRIIVGNGHSLVLGPVGEDTGMSGVIAVRTGGTLDFAGGVDPQQTVRFADNAGTLILGDPQDFGATIRGFQAGDTIDLANTAADGFTYANGVLTLTSGGNPTASLAISGTLGASQFALAPDGQGGTDVTAAAGQLFSFTFVYADGAAYYNGTVADDGSLGYARIVNSGNPTISEPDGTYTLANDGPATTQPSGAVTVNLYTASPPAANAAQSFVPLATSQGQFDGHTGLGSESDSIQVSGTLFGFSPNLEFHPLLAS